MIVNIFMLCVSQHCSDCSCLRVDAVCLCLYIWLVPCCLKKTNKALSTEILPDELSRINQNPEIYLIRSSRQRHVSYSRHYIIHFRITKSSVYGSEVTISCYEMLCSVDKQQMTISTRYKLNVANKWSWVNKSSAV